MAPSVGIRPCIAASAGATTTNAPVASRSRWIASARRAAISGVGPMPSYGSASHAGSSPTRSAPRYAAISAASASASWGPGDDGQDRACPSRGRARRSPRPGPPRRAPRSAGRAPAGAARTAPTRSTPRALPPSPTPCLLRSDPDNTNRPRRVAAGPPRGSLPTVSSQSMRPIAMRFRRSMTRSIRSGSRSVRRASCVSRNPRIAHASTARLNPKGSTFVVRAAR